ncbi:hypothetical protein M422DRAFT_54865 [Sphaerobolus stellatus SS14]|uniref:Uncharacterized protein n=1 Tax=Sphaerobolus stellatus (strain SS14) TaxID=990650 RepID=A0A0C9UFT0_SPHS4|nr:hypothetical protein M422DRAFT_54865 [Sphaerobolus stellatus SS14]
MTTYWQLTGPKSHIFRQWQQKDFDKVLAEAIFDAFATKNEEGVRTLELILGIERSGAAHLLMPYDRRRDNKVRYNRPNQGYSREIPWKKKEDAYPASHFASLSPIQIETVERLEKLISERNNGHKNTKAAKQRVDTSKANGRFDHDMDNLARAEFEQQRCLWRLMHDKLENVIYSLPPTPTWAKKLPVFSLAFTFWRPSQTKRLPTLLNAAITKLELPIDGEARPGITTYFIAEENIGLKNYSEIEVNLILNLFE